jgi:hypothetical protein
MRGLSDKSVWILLILLVIGGIIGSWLGVVLVKMWPGFGLLGQTEVIGLPPTTLDLQILSVTFGFALTPQRAVMLAAVLNFIGALSGTAVAGTIGKGIVAPQDITQEVVVASLIGAICWNIITWLSGIPSSSSHALIGGIVGAVVAGYGFGALIWAGLQKIILILILSPILGFTSGYLIMTILFFVFGRKSPISKL